MKRIFAMLVLLLIVAVTPAAADDDFFSYDLVFPDVYIQDGVNADINVLVIQNSDRRCHNGHKGHRGKSIIALHGQVELGEQEAILYEYLTNDTKRKRFAVVASDDAVHSMYISNPRGLLEALVPSSISLP